MKKGLGDSQPDDPEPSGLRGSRDDVGKEVFDGGFEFIAIDAILDDRQGVDSCAQIGIRVRFDVVIRTCEVPAKVEKDGSIRLGDLAGVDELVDIRHVSPVVEAETRIHAIVREGQHDFRAHLDHGVLDVILRGFQGFQGFEGTGVEDLVSFVVADAVKLPGNGSGERPRILKIEAKIGETFADVDDSRDGILISGRDVIDRGAID